MAKRVVRGMNDNISMNTEIEESMNDNIHMHPEIEGSMNDNIHMDTDIGVSQIVLSCTPPGVRPYTLVVIDCTILHLSQC